MKKDNEFYIGWKEDMSENNSRFLKKILIPIFIIIPILVFAVVIFQKPFNNFIFEFGKSTQLTGRYYNIPAPIFIVDKDGTLPDSVSHELILVGYGKFGAKGIIQNIEKKSGGLNGKKIILSGTLIHGDGKTLLELTEQENSFIKIIDKKVVNAVDFSKPKDISLSGEIIDPKCYFGVMKPGEGKTHKSCAIRCISGGIPPVFKTKDIQNNNQYFLLLDQNGQEVNEQVLPLVAEQITLKGKTYRFSNWDVLLINTDDLKSLK